MSPETKLDEPRVVARPIASTRRGVETHETAETNNGGEDFSLRFAPRHYRKWTPLVVASSALGGIAYLADFSIGATIGVTHGTGNAIGGILIAALLIFISSFPLAYYAARYNLDLDLITRGAALVTWVPSSPT